MEEKILIVDDSELNREILAEILRDSFETECLENGQAAIDYLSGDRKNIAAVLLDLRMPGIDGFGVLDFMKKNGLIGKYPVLIISSETAPETEKKCLSMGVSDFIHKPYDSDIVKHRVRNAVDLFTYKNSLEEKVAEQTETLTRQNEILIKQADIVKHNNENIIDLLGTVVEYRNLESGEHIKRVKGFTEILARRFAVMYPEYGLTDEKIEVIVAASALHDIGKIAIADSVLLKPGRLTKDEFEYMKSHTLKGCEIIEQIEGAWDENYKKASYDICRSHHERYDGKGYPDGLKGDEIPISAQLVSVADVYDALVSERVYKSAFDKEKAFHMIVKGECGVFSPKLMECFRQSKDEFEKLQSVQHESDEV